VRMNPLSMSIQPTLTRCVTHNNHLALLVTHGLQAQHTFNVAPPYAGK
jgi:hypothetical protein